MARGFLRASSQSAWVATSGTYTTRLSFAARARTASAPTDGNQHFLFSLGNNGGSGVRVNLYLSYRNVSGTFRWNLGYTNGDSSYNENYFNNTLTGDQWYTVSGSVDWSINPDDVALYVDGSPITRSGTFGSTNVTPDGGSYRLTAGALSHAGSTSSYWDGRIAELALWDAALTAGEHAAYAAGASPLLVRRSGLIAYTPFLSGVNDRVLGAGTDVSTTNVDHPRVIYPRSPVRPLVASAPATAPEIAVTGNATNIADGDGAASLTDHTDFGTTPQGTTKSRTFTITNSGDANLTISSVALSGANAAEFTITADPTGTIAPAGTGTLTIQADADNQGTFAATVTINSNDANEAAFDFAIAAVVSAPSSSSSAGAIRRARGRIYLPRSMGSRRGRI